MKKFKAVCSGGGTRGTAFTGAFQFFREKGWEPEEGIGISAGAIFMAGLASGRTPKKLLELQKEMLPGKLLDARILFFWPFADGTKGPIKGKKILAAFREYLPADYAHTVFPLHIRTHNWTDRRGYVWTKGDLPKHVRASMSLPIFDMVKLKGDWYEDGGVSGNFPLDYTGWARLTDAPVVGFSFKPITNPRPKPKTKFDRLMGTIDDMIAAIDREHIEDAGHMPNVKHVVLETSHGGLELDMDEKAADEMYDEGYASAERWWKETGGL